MRIRNLMRPSTAEEAIVQAVNAHKDLLAACEGLLAILPECECDNTHEQNNTKCLICMAYDIVAKAKGGA